MKLRQLEMLLERVSGFENPSAEREQYQTPATLAARLLHTAMMRGDITGKTVLDLGSGTGMLAIGAALLGGDVIAVEEDPKAISIAEANADDLGCRIRFIQGDLTESGIADIIPKADTGVMNPPFGAQNEHADRPFIDMALEKTPVWYGIFNAGTMPFLAEYIKNRGGIVYSVSAGLSIPRTFTFHTRDRVEIPVEIHVVRRK
ncbi:MAG: METTL5 family protein [Methanospirillum sp.]|nr:METTL5 family protein [Methanospirillum sp.]